MSPASTRPIPEPSQWKPLEPACDEAVLPPGIRLADETRTARHCFILLEGTATVEADGNRLPELASGAYVGRLDQSGRPLPPEGLTIQIATRSRVLVIDARRLADLVDADPAAAAAWRRLAQLIRPSTGLPPPPATTHAARSTEPARRATTRSE
jgi:CRP-like cAMP-binding protein